MTCELDPGTWMLIGFCGGVAFCEAAAFFGDGPEVGRGPFDTKPGSVGRAFAVGTASWPKVTGP